LPPALDPLVAQLRAALPPTVSGPPPQPAPGPPVDPARSRAAAAQLAHLLSESDPGAAEFVEANRAVLRPLFGDETWPEFEAQIQDYAFAEAQERLQHALGELTS
jgi:hypothetical protein